MTRVAALWPGSLGFIASVMLLSALFGACGGSPRPAPASNPTKAALPPPLATGNPDNPFTTRAVWQDQNGQDSITRNCLVNGPRDAEGKKLCVAQSMQSAGGAPETIDFYLATGRWLTGFVKGSRMDAGLAAAPGDVSSPPTLVFLNGQPRVQLESDLFKQVFPPDSTDDAAPFRNAPMVPAMLAAAQRKFANADDPLDLKLFDVVELESFAFLPSEGQEFIVEVGIHNFCHDCGIGVAARYAFDFDRSGNLKAINILGLCQGRPVTDDVAGAGRITYNEFSGVKIKPGGGGVTEPYLLTVPGLPACPQHVTF